MNQMSKYLLTAILASAILVSCTPDRASEIRLSTTAEPGQGPDTSDDKSLRETRLRFASLISDFDKLVAASEAPKGASSDNGEEIDDPAKSHSPARLRAILTQKLRDLSETAYRNEVIGDLNSAVAVSRQSIKLMQDNGLDATSGIYHKLGIYELKLGNTERGFGALERARQLGIQAGTSQMIHASITELAWSGRVGRTEGIDELADLVRGWVRARNSNPDASRIFSIERDAMAEYADGLRRLAKRDPDGAIASIRSALPKMQRMIAFLEGRGQAVDMANALFDREMCLNMMISLVEAYKLKGDLATAEIEAQTALRWVISSGQVLNSDALNVTAILSDLLISQGRISQALQLSNVTMRALAKLGAPKGAIARIATLLNLASANVAEGRYSDAVRFFDEASSSMSGSPELRRSFIDGSVRYAFALYKIGRYADALNIVEQRLDIARQDGSEERGSSYFRALALKGLIFASLKRQFEGKQILETALPNLLRPTLSDPGDVTLLFQERFRKSILESALELASQEIVSSGEQATIGHAFLLAEAARISSVDLALQAYSVRQASGGDAVSKLIRDEQDTTQKLTLLRTTLANAVAAQEPPESIRRLRNEVINLTNVLDAARLRVQSQLPKYANARRPSPVSTHGLQEVLASHETFIAMYSAESALFAWGIQKDQPIKFLKVSGGDLDGLKDAARRVRATIAPEVDALDSIPDFDSDAAHLIYQRLVEPLLGPPRDDRTLIVASHGFMDQVPFQVLVERPGALTRSNALKFQNHREIAFLIKSIAIAQLPSASALVHLRNQPRQGTQDHQFVGFGDPIFNDRQLSQLRSEEAQSEKPSMLDVRGGNIKRRSVKIESVTNSTLDWRKVDQRSLAGLIRLPETRQEVLTIAGLLNANTSRDIFLGIRANEDQVKKADLSKARVIMFATHGLVAGDLPGLSEPALAMTSPRLAGISGSGLLTSSEIMELRLNADWVILSACNSAAGDEAGAEAISGLVRSFFYAGARSVLATNWSVESTSAQLLTVTALARDTSNDTETRAKALRRAMISVMASNMKNADSGAEIFSYAHPMFWAPYSLFGDPGR